MADQFVNYSDSATSPSTHWEVITPSDTVDLVNIPKGILIVSAGNVAMIGVNAASTATGVTFPNCAAYTYLPCRPRRVLSTGTTATTIIALY